MPNYMFWGFVAAIAIPPILGSLAGMAQSGRELKEAKKALQHQRELQALYMSLM